jgi:hypothetical protein
MHIQTIHQSNCIFDSEQKRKKKVDSVRLTSTNIFSLSFFSRMNAFI